MSLVLETVMDEDQRRVWIGCAEAAAANAFLNQNNGGFRVWCGEGRWTRTIKPDPQIVDMPPLDANSLLRGEVQWEVVEPRAAVGRQCSNTRRLGTVQHSTTQHRTIQYRKNTVLQYEVMGPALGQQHIGTVHTVLHSTPQYSTVALL